MHNIPVTLKLVKKVITNLDFSNVSGPDSFSMMILKNYDSKI